MTTAELRKELGWTREKLAAELGLSFSTVRNWELGICNPSRMAQAKIDALLREGKGEGK